MLEHLRNLREDSDLSQKEVVEKLQIHQTTYSDYELGRLNIPIPVLKQLAELFNTSIDYIVDLTDEVTPYEKKK